MMTDFVVGYLDEMSKTTIALYQQMMDEWATLKALQMDWEDVIKVNHSFAAFECYLDLCHMLYEVRATADHIENAYETALDALARLRQNEGNPIEK